MRLWRRMIGLGAAPDNSIMPSPTSGSIPAGDLIAFAARAFEAAGLTSGDAQRAAELTIEADLTGAGSHGCFRLPEYVAQLRSGSFNARATITVDQRGASTALVDGGNGIGHLAAAIAAETAIALASDTGVGWVGVKNSNHSGAGAIYAAMPAQAGMVGIYAAVAAANHMAPWGGTEPMLGTNPLAIAVPQADGAPFLMDFATSLGSFGAIKKMAQRSQPIPDGWMIDRISGLSLTDPGQINLGALMPMADHKGSGLAIAIGLIAGTLNGAAFGADVRSFDRPATGAANVGQTIIAFDPSRFLPREIFEGTVARHLAEIAAVNPMPGTASVRWPGENRQRIRAERLAQGIPLDATLLSKLEAVARDLGIPPLPAAHT